MSDERLLIALEARIRDFERNMSKAERKGTQTYTRLRNGSRNTTTAMERDMLRSTSSINTALASTSTRMGAFSSNSLRMMSMQLSQVASQGAATGNYLQALAIQAPDLALGFGAVGIAAGALVPVLFSLVKGQIDLGTETETAEQRLENFMSAIRQFEQLARIAAQPVDELREKYGRFAEDIQSGAQVAAQAALSTAMLEFQGVSEGLSEALQKTVDAYFEWGTALNQLSEAERALGERTRSNEASFAQFERTVAEAKEALDDAAAAIGLTYAQARDLDEALDTLASAEGMESIAVAASAALDVMNRVADSTGNVPPEVAKIVENLNAVLEVAAAGAVAFDDMASAASNASREIWQNPAFRLGGATGPDDARAQLYDQGRLGGVIVGAERVRLPSSNRSRGGSTSAVSAEAQLVQRYVDQTRTALERYNAELATLAELNERGFFAEHPEAYSRAVAQVNEEFHRSQHQDFLEGVRSIADAMASAITTGENMRDALRQVFQRMAQDILSSGIRDALETVFEPSNNTGFFGSILSALSGSSSSRTPAPAAKPLRSQQARPTSKSLGSGSTGGVIELVVTTDHATTAELVDKRVAGAEVRIQRALPDQIARYNNDPSARY